VTVQEAIDTQARQDIAVLRSEMAGLKEGLNGIKGTLDHIFLAMMVGMASIACAAIYNWIFHIKP
jgi:hypothetical protein